jgi:acyl carrier protein
MDRKGLATVLLEVLEDETGEKYPDLEDTTNLRDGLHLDSLDMVSTVLQIEVRLKVHIDSSELDKVATVGNLLDLLQTKLAESDARHAA